jgi:hypothetical protein
VGNGLDHLAYHTDITDHYELVIVPGCDVHPATAVETRRRRFRCNRCPHRTVGRTWMLRHLRHHPDAAGNDYTVEEEEPLRWACC